MTMFGPFIAVLSRLHDRKVRRAVRDLSEHWKVPDPDVPTAVTHFRTIGQNIAILRQITAT